MSFTSLSATTAPLRVVSETRGQVRVVGWEEREGLEDSRQDGRPGPAEGSRDGGLRAPSASSVKGEAREIEGKRGKSVTCATVGCARGEREVCVCVCAEDSPRGAGGAGSSDGGGGAWRGQSAPVGFHGGSHGRRRRCRRCRRRSVKRFSFAGWWGRARWACVRSASGSLVRWARGCAKDLTPLLALSRSVCAYRGRADGFVLSESDESGRVSRLFLDRGSPARVEIPFCDRQNDAKRAAVENPSHEGSRS